VLPSTHSGTTPLFARDNGRMRLITSSLSMARQLWRYGEPELAERALVLKPRAVLAIGDRAVELFHEGAAAKVWPGGPKDGEIMLAVIEHLDGVPRPCRRVRRLPESELPPHLQATLAARYEATRPVEAALDEERRRAKH
jgi:hypothetical protein